MADEVALLLGQNVQKFLIIKCGIVLIVVSVTSLACYQEYQV